MREASPLQALKLIGIFGQSFLDFADGIVDVAEFSRSLQPVELALDRTDLGPDLRAELP